MNKQVIAAAAAGALFAGGLVGALAFTGDDFGVGSVHTVPGGRTATGPMHEMDDGQTMAGMTLTRP